MALLPFYPWPTPSRNAEAEHHLGALALPQSLLTSMQISIYVVLAALQVFCRYTSARVLTAHVLEEAEGIRQVNDSTLARKYSEDKLEISYLEVFSNVSARRFDDGTIPGSRKNVSTQYVYIQRVTKGRSTLYSSNLFDCWRRCAAQDPVESKATSTAPSPSHRLAASNCVICGVMSHSANYEGQIFNR